MFGKKENDGFLDGFARFVMNFVLIFFLVSVIWYLISEVINAFRYGQWQKIISWVVAFIIIWWLWGKMEENVKKNREAAKIETVEDTRSGQEIWNDNMKDYDAERGY